MKIRMANVPRRKRIPPVAAFSRNFQLIEELFFGNDGLLGFLQRVPVSLRSALGLTLEEPPGMLASATSSSI
jgi:hypothetical protein